MARTINPTEHAVRREAFVDAAERVIRVKGYEQTTIQDVLDEAGASRGAFYHYFDSKAALLDAIVERFVDVGVARYAPSGDDADRTAIEKLEGFFGDIASYKAEQRDLIMSALETWLSEDNAVVREHFRRGLVRRLEPMLTAIVHQGVAEGTFKVPSPAATARVLVSLIQGLNEAATDLYVARQANEIGAGEVMERLLAYQDAFERVLGAPAGSIHLGDPAIIREWFG